MHRTLYLVGFGYLAICGAVVLRHRAPPPPPPTHAPAPIRRGSGAAWFAGIKLYCNAVEAELAQRNAPAPATTDGQGYSAACYALGGKLSLARTTIDRLPRHDRAAAAHIVFEVAHPVADAGDARVESRVAAWREVVPLPIALLAGVVTAAGAAAGLAAATPILLFTSPAVAGGLASLAAGLRRKPVWNPPPAGRSPLPAEAERAAVRALAALPAGSARALLVDLLRRATAATVDGNRIGPLVVAACGVARDLAALEQHLGAFDARRDRLADAPAGWLDALSRCERGRDVLTQRLLEASAALSGWQARATEGEGTDTLNELARALGDEGRRQEAAARAVAELLA